MQVSVQQSISEIEQTGEVSSKRQGENKQDFIQEVKEAVAENNLIDRKLAHSTFIGPPGSGKSSLMYRLLHRARKEFSGSTGVSDDVVIVDIDVPSTFQPVTVLDPSTWEEVEYDLSLVRQMSNVHVTSPPEDLSQVSAEVASPPIAAPPNPSTASSVPEPAPLASTIQGKPVVISEKKFSDEEIRKMIDAVVKKCGGYRKFQGSYSKSFSLYLRDTGGQVAFQEMLSVVIVGPSIFIFVFRVDVDLKKKFKVEYRVSPEQSLNCNTSSISTEEALLQCLASVYAIDTAGTAVVKTHKPLVLIVGTHKDKLGSSAGRRIAVLNEHLDSLIESSSCFQDLVQYADREKGQVMFTVDNTSKGDEDFKLIRSKIYSLVSERDEFTIEYPVSYLLFALELRHEQRSVLSFAECRAIAAKYGIESDRVSHLLQFLHSRVGVIQYFDKEGLVMVKPRVLFSMVTDLVKRTFSRQSLTPRERKDFQKGILTAPLIKKVIGEGDIDCKRYCEEFLQLLIRLHLITPFTFPGDQEARFFMPCVLSHVQESSQEDLETDILPLSVQFQCEHCPKGLFGVLITHLMSYGEQDSRIFFTLMEDKISRDQVSFEVHSDAADQDEVSLKALPSHLEINFFPSWGEERGLSSDEVCSYVRQVIEGSICKSLKYFNYDVKKVGPVMSFKCNACHGLHQIKKVKGMPHKIYCKKTRTTKRIPASGRCWFNDGNVSSSSAPSASASAILTFSHVELPRTSGTKLTEQDITRLYLQLRPHSNEWYNIALGLQFTIPELFIIKASPAYILDAPSSYLSAMLSIWQQWAPGDARGSRDYATLESLKAAVDRAGLGVAAQNLQLNQ